MITVVVILVLIGTIANTIYFAYGMKKYNFLSFYINTFSEKKGFFIKNAPFITLIGLLAYIAKYLDYLKLLQFFIIVIIFYFLVCICYLLLISYWAIKKRKNKL